MKEKYHIIEVRGIVHQKFNQVFGFRGHESKESVIQALMESFDPDTVQTDSVEIVDIREVSREEMDEILETINEHNEEERVLQ